MKRPAVFLSCGVAFAAAATSLHAQFAPTLLFEPLDTVNTTEGRTFFVGEPVRFNMFTNARDTQPTGLRIDLRSPLSGTFSEFAFAETFATFSAADIGGTLSSLVRTGPNAADNAISVDAQIGTREFPLFDDLGRFVFVPSKAGVLEIQTAPFTDSNGMSQPSRFDFLTFTPGASAPTPDSVSPVDGSVAGNFKIVDRSCRIIVTADRGDGGVYTVGETITFTVTLDYSQFLPDGVDRILSANDLNLLPNRSGVTASALTFTDEILTNYNNFGGDESASQDPVNGTPEAGGELRAIGFAQDFFPPEVLDNDLVLTVGTFTVVATEPGPLFYAGVNLPFGGTLNTAVADGESFFEDFIAFSTNSSEFDVVNVVAAP